MYLRFTWYVSTKLYGVIAEERNHHGHQIYSSFFISKLRRVLNALFFLLGNSPEPEFYAPTFRNTQFHHGDGTDRVFRNVGT
jgi:hypothetical protein